MTLSHYIAARAARASALRLAAATAIAAAVIAGCGSGSSHGSAGSSETVRSDTTTSGGATSTSGGFTSQALVSGVRIEHTTPSGKVPVNQPDDMTMLGTHIFVGFQNGVGPQGEPTSAGNQGAGNRNSTIVEFSTSGSPVAQWDVAGHVDGLTADTAAGRVVVTTNEDAHAHLYTIAPGNPQPTAYQVPSLPHNGGLDAISFWHGMMLISASAPGTSGRPHRRPATRPST
jgi:hypothetical protein